ncbi:jg2412 [Pararge aegeria aegeria]|uniref:Jg2412 protein n=1 Tax=Pararge aegeria aegeria TaxID=348720 RepID=A0A8S4QNQ8_9NEOP|nr:jg2412 [Pararge aegeria aegeria]
MAISRAGSLPHVGTSMTNTAYNNIIISKMSFIRMYLLNNRESTQMIRIAVLARLVVDLNLSGKQIAYQRSTEIKVSVNTDTVTDTD